MWMPTKPSDLFIFGDFLSASGRRGNGVEDARSVYLEPQLLSKSLQMCGGGAGGGQVCRRWSRVQRSHSSVQCLDQASNTLKISPAGWKGHMRADLLFFLGCGAHHCYPH